VAIEGPLKELSIHDVFQLLDLSQKTGVLRVTSELRQNQGVVVFDEGSVVAAQIQSNPHPLGKLLLRSGKVSEADLSRARALQEAGDARRLGEVLVGIGAISTRELGRQVRAQIEEVVFELMSWSEGYFAFEEGAAAEAPPEAVIRIPTAFLLMEAARRIDEWSRIEKKIAHLGIVPRFAADVEGMGPLDLLPTEWEVLAVIDGERDVRLIALALGRAEFDVAKTLFGLASAGIILLEDPARRVAPPAVVSDLAVLLGQAEEQLALGELEQAIESAQTAVYAHPDQPLAHLTHGRALLAAARFEDAVNALARSLELDPSSIPLHRLLGYALVAAGRFQEAGEAWERWQAAGPKSPEEETQVPMIERVRQAAQTIDVALRGTSD
jgi:cytochrome c-type biogenesis protein CcmH/NrfG